MIFRELFFKTSFQLNIFVCIEFFRANWKIIPENSVPLFLFTMRQNFQLHQQQRILDEFVNSAREACPMEADSIEWKYIGSA